MKFWVGVTDNNWFKFQSSNQADEVNFWQPGGRPAFKSAPTGMPFLFKLKRPHNHIAGGGFFVTFTTLPLSLAWEIFGPKNGAKSIDDLRSLIAPLRSEIKLDDEIGCTVLSNCFYMDPSIWMSDPPGWSSNIVQGKGYDTNNLDGGVIWESVRAYLEQADEPKRLVTGDGLDARTAEMPILGAKYGNPSLVKPRIGQSAFRVLVTDAYNKRCALTGENTLVALEAAHIVPYSGEGNHDVQNGLLLRADFHRLFDVGLVSVTPDLRIRVSPRIRETWFNGKAYYRLDGQPLAVVPNKPELRPDGDRLKWHLENRFQS